jgi:hypothetical protein
MAWRPFALCEGDFAPAPRALDSTEMILTLFEFGNAAFEQIREGMNVDLG